MTGSTILLWLVALIYVAAFAMFAAKWAGDGLSRVKKRNRSRRMLG